MSRGGIRSFGGPGGTSGGLHDLVYGARSKKIFSRRGGARGSGRGRQLPNSLGPQGDAPRAGRAREDPAAAMSATSGRRANLFGELEERCSK